MPSWRRGSGWNRVAVCLLLASLLILVGAAIGQEPEPRPAEPAGSPAAPAQPAERMILFEKEEQAAVRDSLRKEIEVYSRAVADLRDSLSLDQLDIELDDRQRERLRNTIEDLTQVIESIGEELGQMELEISNNRISLLDAQGEGIVIDVPENLDEQLSQGFQLLQEVILQDMSDETLQEVRRSWTWGKPGKMEAPPERKIVRGNIVKVQEGLQVPVRDDVRGNVVVVLADGQISGRVDGNVVAVFGNLVVDPTAEITGELVVVGGFLSQDPEAEVASVTVIDPLPGLTDGDFSWLFGFGIMGLLTALSELVLLLVLALFGLALTPRANLERVLTTLDERPWMSLLVGLPGSIIILVGGLALIGILVVTVVGAPVGLLVGVGMLLLTVLAIALVGMALGRRVCRLVSGSCGSDWMVLLMGILMLDAISLLGRLAGLIPGFETGAQGLVILGAGIKLAAFFFGTGGLLLGRFGRTR